MCLLLAPLLPQVATRTAKLLSTRKRLRSLPIGMLLRPLLRPLLIGAGLIMSPVLLVIILLRSKSLPDDPAFSTDNLKVAVTGYSSATATYASNALTVKASNGGENAPSVNITVSETSISGQTLTIDKGNSITLYEGQQVELTATYSRANGNKNVSYAWTSNPDATFRNDTSAKATFKGTYVRFF